MRLFFSSYIRIFQATNARWNIINIGMADLANSTVMMKLVSGAFHVFVLINDI